MLDNKDIVRNKDPPENKDGYSNLEQIIKLKPLLDMNIMDFLLIAGWDYFCSPIYRKASGKLKDELYRYVKARREGIPSAEKGLQSRFGNWIIRMGYLDGKLRTLRDVKSLTEKKGLIYHQMSYKTFAHFNEVLRMYGIESFKIGGKYNHWPSVAKKLKKYGLEPV